MAVEVKVVAMALGEVPYGCPECGTATLTLDGRGLFDSFPARGCCANYHNWEDNLLTVGDLKAILAARTGRTRPEDDDTFEIAIGGAVLAGILHPDLTPEDVKAVGRIYWRRIIKPAVRKQKRQAVRATKKALGKAAAAATQPGKDAVTATTATVIRTAWGLQAGGVDPDPDYQPEPVIPCAACKDGHIEIDSHIHGNTRVRCSVCHGTGEID